MSKHIPGYEITQGKVFSIVHNWRGYGIREMKQFLVDGYLCVRLTINGKRKRYMVHRLIALKFLGYPPPKYEIRHLNGIKTDNRIKNLAWGTKQNNANDREKHGYTSRGLKHSIAIKKGLAKNE